MDPPPLNVRADATVQAIPVFHEEDGSTCAVVLIKVRYRQDASGRLSREPDAEIRIADELWDPDAPDTSSLKYPSDLCQSKPSTDVIVVGSAIAPGRRPVAELEVALRAGPIDKRLRVVGPRAWYDAVGHYALTPPSPFEALELRWERAFGGADYDSDPERPLEEPRNPSGRGLVRDPAALLGLEGPNVEHPGDAMETHRSRPRPAGLGAIKRSWAPRRDYVGTFDDAWMEERMPLLPLDFDPRFHQAAPPDQVTGAPLRGGEPVAVEGMHADGPFAFSLPKHRFFVGVRTDDGLTEHPPQLDLLLLEPNDRAFEMTWRSRVPLPRESRRLHYVQVNEKRWAR